MLLDKISLAASEATESNGGRPVLGCIKVTKDKTTGTDGNILIEIATQDSQDDEFPLTGNLTPLVLGDNDSLLISSKDAAKISKTIPKRSPLPILENAQVCQGNGSLPVITTDLESPTVHQIKPGEGTFPNTDLVWPKGTPKVEIGIDLKLLSKLVHCLQSAGVEIAKLSIYDALTPIKVDSVRPGDRKVSGLIMPCRLPKPRTEPEPVSEEVSQEPY